ncbi:MAG: hypothetical protein LQ340_005116 [Diploschistes diacapsis]|nr:MAG: hypothetical protein LQ340_005116 [Diploschistes diacapsis]
MHFNRNIAIIGAGPGGLTLGRLLHLAGIPFAIFEGEANAAVRGQGGTLDLHEDTGLLAIKKGGLWDAFKKYVRYDGEAVILSDKEFNKIYEKDGAAGEQDSTGRPEIDRKRLREILLESVPAEKILWGRRLKSLGEDFTLTFQDGSTESGFDLVVGADGAWSKVRPLLTDVKPFYTGINGIALQIVNAESRAPDLYKMVNKGSVFSFSDGKSIVAQYNGDGSVQVSTWFRAPEDWSQMTDKDVKDNAQTKVFLGEIYTEWSPHLKALFERADNDYNVERSLYMLPVDHRWSHRRGVTLLGDAAHLMTPFAGEGVNVAMTDAMHLADAIIKSAEPDDFDANVKAFEEEMFVRAGEVQALTKANMDDFYSTEPFHVWMPRVAQRMVPTATGVIFSDSNSPDTKEIVAEAAKE